MGGLWSVVTRPRSKQDEQKLHTDTSLSQELTPAVNTNASNSSAWVTLATNDSYSLGALVLAHSLKKVGTVHQLAVLITPAVSPAIREQLSLVFDVVQMVDVLDSKDEVNLALLKRPELGITFTKLHCWRLTQFTKGVFLDADTLVVRNCDELFEREELSAAPDVGWPDCFNSGVFVFRPSVDTFHKLIQFAVEKGSFDGGDQGLLNLFFSNWATDDIHKHLPFVYNLTSVAVYSYIPAFKQYGSETRIVHFIGAVKPWLQPVDPTTRTVTPSSDSAHLQPLLQQWWDIFIEKVHPGLNANLDCASGMLSFFAQLACSPDPLDSTLARNDPVPDPVPDPSPSFPQPYTPYIEKDDARQYNLPYQPFQVVNSEGELLNITFADFARDCDMEEVKQLENFEYEEPEMFEPEPKSTPSSDENVVMQKSEEETLEQPEDPSVSESEPDVQESLFNYNHFVPDEHVIHAYLEHNVQEYQPYDHENYYAPREHSWIASPPELPVALPRFLTIPEDDPRQGHVPYYSEPSSEMQQGYEFHEHDLTDHRELWKEQHDSKTVLHRPHNEPSWQNDENSHRAPSPVPEVHQEPQPEPPPITRSKSMSNLVIDATNADSFHSMTHWKSHPDFQSQPVETPKKLPGLKPLLPKVRSPSNIESMPKYTESTEVHMVSEYSDPFGPPVDKLGFVERAIMKRVQSRKGIFDVPQGALEPGPPLPTPLPVVIPPIIQEMNEYVDFAECKRQSGNVVNDITPSKTEEEPKTFTPRSPHRREKRSSRRVAEKWNPPEKCATYDVDEILKRLSNFSAGYSAPSALTIIPPVTNGVKADSNDFSRYRHFVQERTDVVGKGLAAFDDIINNDIIRITESPAERLFRGSSLENLIGEVSDSTVLPSSTACNIPIKLRKGQRLKPNQKSENSRKRGSKLELSRDFGPIQDLKSFVKETVVQTSPFAAPPGESLLEKDIPIPDIVVCVASPEEELSNVSNLTSTPLKNFDQTYVVANVKTEKASSTSNEMERKPESAIKVSSKVDEEGHAIVHRIIARKVVETPAEEASQCPGTPLPANISSSFEKFTTPLNGTSKSLSSDDSFLSALSSNSSISTPEKSVEKKNETMHSTVDDVTQQIEALKLLTATKNRSEVECHSLAMVTPPNFDVKEREHVVLGVDLEPTNAESIQVISDNLMELPQQNNIEKAKENEKKMNEIVMSSIDEDGLKTHKKLVEVKLSMVDKTDCENENEKPPQSMTTSETNGSIPVDKIVNSKQTYPFEKVIVPLLEDSQNIEVTEETLKFDLSKLVSDVDADELAFSNLETSSPSGKAQPFFVSSTVATFIPTTSYAAVARKEVIPSSSTFAIPPSVVFPILPRLQDNGLQRTRKTASVKKKPRPQVPKQTSEETLLSNAHSKNTKKTTEKSAIEFPTNKFELLPDANEVLEIESSHKKKVKKAVKRFAAPASYPNFSFPSSSHSECIVPAAQEEHQLYLPEPNDSPGIVGAIAQLSLEPGKELSASSSEAQAEYLRRQSWETGKMDYMGRDSFANVWSKISETLSQQALPEVKSIASTSVPIEAHPVSCTTILDSDSIETLPTDVTTSLGEIADDDIIFDPPPAQELNIELPGILEEIEETEVEVKVVDDIPTESPIVEVNPLIAQFKCSSEVVAAEDSIPFYSSVGVTTEMPAKEIINVNENSMELPIDRQATLMLAETGETFGSENLSENESSHTRYQINSQKSDSSLGTAKNSPDPVSGQNLTIEVTSTFSNLVDYENFQSNEESPNFYNASENFKKSGTPYTVPDSKLKEDTTTSASGRSQLESGVANVLQDLQQGFPSPSISSDSSSAFAVYKPAMENAQSTETALLRRHSLVDEEKEKKGVFTKLLELVGVVKKKEDSEGSSVFYDSTFIKGKGEFQDVTDRQNILKAPDLTTLDEEKNDREPKKRSLSPRIVIPSVPNTNVIEATPPTSPNQKPPRRDSEALTVDNIILETPPVVEKKTSTSIESEETLEKKEINRDSVIADLNEILAKAEILAEEKFEPIYSNVEKKSSDIVSLKPPAPSMYSPEDYEELQVISEEVRKHPRGSMTSKLSGQILKAIPPPRRKAISDARTPAGSSETILKKKSLEVVLSTPEGADSLSRSVRSSPAQTPSPPPVPPRRHRSIQPQPPPKRKAKK